MKLSYHMKKWSKRPSRFRLGDPSDRGPPSQELPSWDSSTHTQTSTINCTNSHIQIDQPFLKKNLCSQESAVLRRVEVRAISVLLRPGKECNSMRFVERGHLFPLTDLITNPNGGVPFFLLRQAGGGPDSLSQ